ncbi:MAG: hypothetical protein ABW007_24530 [Chitinophagaceae bacterium]
MTYDIRAGKSIWTEDDYEQMEWHDNFAHKIVMHKDLLLDLDSIFKWNKPEVEGMGFTFWISPATLCFHKTKDLSLDIDVFFDGAFEIEDIEKVESTEGMHWTIITQHGEISFLSEGYTQFIRQHPTLEYRHFIPFGDRGRLSVEFTTSQPNPYVLTEQAKSKDQGRPISNHSKNYHPILIIVK